MYLGIWTNTSSAISTFSHGNHWLNLVGLENGDEHVSGNSFLMKTKQKSVKIW